MRRRQAGRRKAQCAGRPRERRAGRFPETREFIDPVGTVPPCRAKPLVVAVQGKTRTAGHELFLAADVRVAASNTVFAQTEAARGIFPAGGATINFVREAGCGNAMRYVLTGDEWGPMRPTG